MIGKLIEYSLLLINGFFCSYIYLRIAKKEFKDTKAEFKTTKTKSEKLKLLLLTTAMFIIFFCFLEIPIFGTCICIYFLLDEADKKIVAEKKLVDELEKKNKQEKRDIDNLYNELKYINCINNFTFMDDKLIELKKSIEEIYQKYLILEKGIIYKEMARNRIQIIFTLIKTSIDNEVFTRENVNLQMEFIETIKDLDQFYDKLLFNITTSKKGYIIDSGEFIQDRLNNFKDTTKLMDDDFERINRNNEKA